MVMTNHNWLFITVSLLIIFGGIGFPILVNFKDIVLYHLRRFWKLPESVEKPALQKAEIEWKAAKPNSPSRVIPNVP